MFDYKDASFYTSYFNEHPLFKLTEEFKESEDEEEKNLYVGYVEVLDTIHPLVLRVEIPKSFPHQHLVFRTKSLSGYPHLIHNGKIKYGDWFCLNTPFAETAKDQLDIEVLRLKEWISRQMNDELPAHIKDKDVIDALRRAIIYEWENPDEVNEIQVDAELTFVGDFFNDLEYFKDRKGFIHCVKTPDIRFYALRNKELSNFELPYILVEEKPKDVEALNFVALRDQYGWDKDICEHLLPDFKLSKTWINEGRTFRFSKKYTLEEALEKIAKVKDELAKDEPYLLGCNESSIVSKETPTKVLLQQKELIENEIEKLELEVRKENGYNPLSSWSMPLKDFDEMTEEEQEAEYIRQAEEDYYIEVYPFEFHYFALGIKGLNGITWHICYTNRRAGQYDFVRFNIGVCYINLKKLISYPLHKLSPQIIDEKMFFGRGQLSHILKNKRIALVGLGAIGSMIAESLTRSGVAIAGLWDNDIVEPGNICRSAYQIPDLGESKVRALAKIIRAINPYIKINDINENGGWHGHNVNYYTYEGGSFYNNINYANQEQSIAQIKDYDIIIDCTGSNEMLHFLSYAVPDATIISLCITNHSKDLLCVTNKNGNPFELRRAYLSRIEQDTKNFYLEGSGCYSPTFLARNCDISSLVNLAIREINDAIDKGEVPGSMVLSHNRRGVLIDRLESYKAEGYDIWMTIPTETLLDAEEMDDAPNGEIGYIFGTYSRDGKMIMVTHIVNAQNARNTLEDAFKTSKGIIDYIGDYRYSGEQPNTYTDNALETLAAKAEDESINTNNPLLAVRNPDGTVSFFLYINNGLVSLVKQS